MQTTGELTNLKMLFERDSQPVVPEPVATPGKPVEPGKAEELARRTVQFSSEEEALKELRAMPIYFASSFALVKPYVSGFDGNVLDVPSLKKIRIDTSWVERKP